MPSWHGSLIEGKIVCKILHLVSAVNSPPVKVPIQQNGNAFHGSTPVDYAEDIGDERTCAGC